MMMGATHFLMKRLPQVATEMALHVLTYNLIRLINILGVKPLMVATRPRPEAVMSAGVRSPSEEFIH
jgi:hypothetical protein